VKAYIDEIASPAGPLAFAVDEDGALIRLHFVESNYGPVLEEDLEDEGYAVEADESRTAAVRGELSEYAHGNRQAFDVPLSYVGDVTAAEQPGVEVRYRGGRVDLPRGHDHFSS